MDGKKGQPKKRQIEHATVGIDGESANRNNAVQTSYKKKNKKKTLTNPMLRPQNECQVRPELLAILSPADGAKPQNVGQWSWVGVSGYVHVALRGITNADMWPWHASLCFTNKESHRCMQQRENEYKQLQKKKSCTAHTVTSRKKIRRIHMWLEASAISRGWRGEKHKGMMEAL